MTANLKDDRHLPFEGLPVSTPNAFWGTLTANALAHRGLQTAVISPGSRSTPLTLAFAAHPAIEAIPLLDERSAAFFALGRARESGRPVALICTSGTAGANYFPAVIEARYSHVPLLILTADRPHELRGCHSGQTIDQLRLYGDYPVFQAECDYPASSANGARMHLRLLREAWEAATGWESGPVHLNFPFRDPLVPDASARDARPGFDADALIAEVFSDGSTPPRAATSTAPGRRPSLPLNPGGRGLIVAGPATPADPECYCRGVAGLSRALGWPVLAEALSPLRNFESLNPNLITGYDAMLHEAGPAGSWQPDRVLQLGSLPTSKRLRQWLERGHVPTLVLDPSSDRRDPLQRPTDYWQARVEDCTDLAETTEVDGVWLEQWRSAEVGFRSQLASLGDGLDRIFEGQIPSILADAAPRESLIFIANSMPVRDAEYFWPANDHRHRIHCSRGANGIDGTLSTALGMAHQAGRPGFLLCGDLALLHDANGFLAQQEFLGSLTILLINNGGGAIFENLPVSQFRAPFERYFLTPQPVTFGRWLEGLGISYRLVSGAAALGECIETTAGQPGIRVVEIPTDPARDVPLRRKLTSDLAAATLGQ